jgi:hypothetical protein
MHTEPSMELVTCWCGKDFNSLSAFGLHLFDIGLGNIKAHADANVALWLPRKLGVA